MAFRLTPGRLPPAAWEDLFAGRKILALSPHSDDLALSLGGALPALARGARLTVVTVFSGSQWAPRRPDLHHRPEDIVPLRIREDQAYCRHLGARLVTLPFSDAGVRGYSASTELTADLDRDDARATVIAALHRILRRAAADLVLAPLGLGGHIDHRITAAAVLTGGRNDLARLFYEDLPYAAEAPSGTRPRVADTLPAHRLGVDPVDLEIGEEGLAAKLRGLDFYPSQIRPQDRAAVIAHARRRGGEGPPVERLWCS